MVLQQPDFNKGFILETDVSKVGIEAIFCQKIEGDILLVAFASQKLGKAERNYSISEKKMLAVLWSMEILSIFCWDESLN